MSAQRKLGENDPGRYQISILVGPCTEEEATQLLEEVADFVNGDLGAACALSTWEEGAE